MASSPRRRAIVIAVIGFWSCAIAAWGLAWPIAWLLPGDGQGAFVYMWAWLLVPFAAGTVVALVAANFVHWVACIGICLAGSLSGIALNREGWKEGASVVLSLLAAAGMVAAAVGGAVGAGGRRLVRLAW